MRAVLVDDTTEIRMLLRLALENVGITIVGEAADGAAGVAVVTCHRPDVVVLDVAMPVMDGFEALPLMRAAVPGVRVVILSGFQASMIGDAAAQAGADAFVEKGQIGELVQTVLRVCSPPMTGPTRPSLPGADQPAVPEVTHLEVAPRWAAPPSPAGGAVGTAPSESGSFASAATAVSAMPAVPWPRSAEPAPAMDPVAIGMPTRDAQLTAELAAARADLEQLAYIVSHDLAEPVGVISGFATRLESHLIEGDTVGREFLTYVTDGADRMHGLLDDVLAYVQAGRDQPMEDLNLPAVWASVRAGLATRITTAGARIDVDTLPEQVRASRLVVSQVLQNLVVNAFTFTAPEVTPHVHVSGGLDSAALGSGWWLEVTDNGIGVAPADRERIFTPFKRVHGRDNYPGNGIGLAICRQLVSRAGGRITVGGSPAGGSVFRVSLPQHARVG